MTDPTWSAGVAIGLPWQWAGDHGYDCNYIRHR